MKFENVYIADVSSIKPSEFLSSPDIENLLNPLYERLNLPKGRLEFITGVKKRGFWNKSVLPSDISSMAARELFTKFSFSQKDISLLMHSSVCRDQDEPSTSSFIHRNLELDSHALCFDVSNACLGMLSSLSVAANMIEAGSIQLALVVSGENSYQLIHDTIHYLNTKENLTRKDIKSSLASLTIGSGGAAILVCHKNYKLFNKEGNEVNKKWKLTSLCSSCDTQAVDLCKGREEDGVLLMETDSEKLLNSGVELAMKNWSQFKALENRIDLEKDKVIMHQVGSAHRERILKALDIDPKFEYSIFENLGNSGSASITTCLDESEKNDFLTNENVILVGIGSGLHTSVAYLERV